MGALCGAMKQQWWRQTALWTTCENLWGGGPVAPYLHCYACFPSIVMDAGVTPEGEHHRLLMAKVQWVHGATCEQTGIRCRM